MWHAEYCLDEDRSETYRAKNLSKIKEWAKDLEKKAGFESSIFKHKFQIDKPYFKQWGTGYHWLSVTKYE